MMAKVSLCRTNLIKKVTRVGNNIGVYIFQLLQCGINLDCFVYLCVDLSPLIIIIYDLLVIY